MTPRYITVRGAGVAASSPYYIGHVQHDRAMSRREAYEYLSQQTGYRPAQLRASNPARCFVVNILVVLRWLYGIWYNL